MQTDMFMSEDMQALSNKIEKIEKSTEKVRKGLFCRQTKDRKELIEFMDETREKMKELERNLYNVTADNFRMKVTLYGEEPKIYSIKEG